MLKLFTDHPQSVNENYWQHLAYAVKFGLRLVLTGIACFIHGLLPFMFTHTGSNMVKKMAKQSQHRVAGAQTQ